MSSHSTPIHEPFAKSRRTTQQRNWQDIGYSRAVSWGADLAVRGTSKIDNKLLEIWMTQLTARHRRLLQLNHKRKRKKDTGCLSQTVTLKLCDRACLHRSLGLYDYFIILSLRANYNHLVCDSANAEVLTKYLSNVKIHVDIKKFKSKKKNQQTGSDQSNQF